ncbi:MAG: hypothetical protein RJA70_4308 [Pseudomonadota bacterium]|jgi:hypothetical protein
MALVGILNGSNLATNRVTIVFNADAGNRIGVETQQ